MHTSNNLISSVFTEDWNSGGRLFHSPLSENDSFWRIKIQAKLRTEEKVDPRRTYVHKPFAERIGTFIKLIMYLSDCVSNSEMVCSA